VENRRSFIILMLENFEHSVLPQQFKQLQVYILNGLCFLSFDGKNLVYLLIGDIVKIYLRNSSRPSL